MSFLKKVPGFRSGTKWKMAVAIIGYLAIFGAIGDVLGGSDGAAPTATKATTQQKTPEPVKLTDADKALLIMHQYKLFSEDELKQFAEFEKKYSALPDAEKTEIKADFDRLSAQKQYQAWIKEQFSLWDGSHVYLKDLVKKNLNDPKSFEHVETTYKDMDDHLIIKMKYRAKNAFGGLILQSVTAKSDYKTSAISVISQND